MSNCHRLLPNTLSRKIMLPNKVMNDIVCTFLYPYGWWRNATYIAETTRSREQPATYIYYNALVTRFGATTADFKNLYRIQRKKPSFRRPYDAVYLFDCYRHLHSLLVIQSRTPISSKQLVTNCYLSVQINYDVRK